MIEEVYRDSDLLVVVKPAGLLCVPGLSSPHNLFDQVRHAYPNARIVHRLDMATSGLVLFALHYEAQKALGQLFEKRRISKCYKALLKGILNTSSGEICLPLLCDWENRPRQKVCWQQGKSAVTRFKAEYVDHTARTTRVSLFPVTGRTHQLRIHMQTIGFAILGDALYLSEESAKTCGRLMLHAETLAFQQPLSGNFLKLHAPCPF